MLVNFKRIAKFRSIKLYKVIFEFCEWLLIRKLPGPDKICSEWGIYWSDLCGVLSFISVRKNRDYCARRYNWYLGFVYK